MNDILTHITSTVGGWHRVTKGTWTRIMDRLGLLVGEVAIVTSTIKWHGAAVIEKAVSGHIEGVRWGDTQIGWT